MYIFELISKLKNRKWKKQVAIEDIQDEPCSHNFAPLDSTKKYFACTKCGEVVEASKLENKNFFIEGD